MADEEQAEERDAPHVWPRFWATLAVLAVAGAAIFWAVGGSGFGNPNLFDANTAWLVTGISISALAIVLFATVVALTGASSALERQREVIQDLRGEELPHVRETVREELEGEEARMESTLTAMERQVEDQRDKIAMLRDQVDDLRGQRDRVDERIDDVETELSNRVNEKLNELEVRFQDMRAAAANAQQDQEGEGAEEARKRFREVLDTERARFEAFLEDARDQIRDLKQESGVSVSETVVVPDEEGETVVASPGSPTGTSRERGGGTHREGGHMDTKEVLVSYHRVEDLPILEEDEAHNLRRAGVKRAHHLIDANLEELARESGVDVRTLRRARDMAELMAVRGIGPKLAERLVNAHVHGIQDLASLEPSELANQLREHAEATDLGTEESEIVVERAERVAPPA